MLSHFFRGVGEIADIHLALGVYGLCKGFGHVEFQTAEAAQKALRLDRRELLDHAVVLKTTDRDGFNRALELDGSELGDDILTVHEAKPWSSRGSGHLGGISRGGLEDLARSWGGGMSVTAEEEEPEQKAQAGTEKQKTFND
ncbi:hypothetical protein RJ640_000846 [Escallonia rubra]|uniref:RRM domain-containing protein n=1 Tax=Escallonia rubra TaxID=112253 RepID=A0AA88U8Z0_9ASTE|nr:hypothetical protein RJ640_000846 [Escallonia rubra]